MHTKLIIKFTDLIGNYFKQIIKRTNIIETNKLNNIKYK